jgi:hypothetical protein
MTETSPEKKLLEVIEKTKHDASASKEPGKPGAIRSLKKEKFSFGSAMGGVFSMGAKLKDAFSLGSSFKFEIKKLNKLLIFVTVLVASYFIFSFISYRNSTAKSIEFQIEDSTNVTGKKIALSSAEPMRLSNDYLTGFIEKVKKRDLFKPIKMEKKATVTAETSESKWVEFGKNLKLVGTSIGLGAFDTYAMVEDTLSKVTYFLRKDETILGARITDIKDDRVLLNYHDNPVELR